MEIVLASLSPRRAEILNRWGVPFRVVPPEGVVETEAKGSGVEVASRLAAWKADAVLSPLVRGPRDRPAERSSGGAGPPAELLVIGADTVVEVEGEVLGKPRGLLEARAMIERLSGETHRVVTAVAVAAPGRPLRLETETSEVVFRPLSRAEIEEHLESGDPEGKAGAYGIQSQGGRLVAGFRGCYHNIVGLPIRRLLAILRELGADVPDAACDCEANPLWLGGHGCVRGT